MKLKLIIALILIIVGYAVFTRFSIHARFGNAIEKAQVHSTKILSDIENRKANEEIGLDEISKIGIGVHDCKSTGTSVSDGEKLILSYKCMLENEPLDFHFEYSGLKGGHFKLDEIRTRVSQNDSWTIIKR